MKRKSIIYAIALCTAVGLFTACEDMLDVTSSSVQYEDSHELNSPADSMYSVVGILSKLQGIADRTVLLGELRGDLVDENTYTENDLRELINHTVSPTNTFCNYSDYYAVINNCNYYLAKVDTNVLVSNQPVLLREKAVVKGIRAWTYLQMAQIYREVPFITEPIVSVVDAEKDFPYYNFDQMCEYFIADLLPYVDTELPNYGRIDGIESRQMFFPIRLLLADMYLWQQDYSSALRYYAEYLYRENIGTDNVGSRVTSLNAITNDIEGVSVSILSSDITCIPMANTKLNGTVSNLNNIFSATDTNEGRRPVSPSRAWKELSEKQDYAFKPSATSSTIRHLACGDLRAYATYGMLTWSDGTFNPNIREEDWYLVDVNSKYLVNYKYASDNTITIYTPSNIYLRLAETLNQLGRCEEAFNILKYGVAQVRIVDGDITFTRPTGDMTATYAGIHAHGAGEVASNDVYVLPTFDESRATAIDSVSYYYSAGRAYADSTGIRVDSVANVPRYHYNHGAAYAACGHYLHETIVGSGKNTVRIYKEYPINYLIEKVEDLIVDEMALETAFEGTRYYDLMRVALRRGDATYLAAKVAARSGESQQRDEALYTRLSSIDNWYIRKK